MSNNVNADVLAAIDEALAPHVFVRHDKQALDILMVEDVASDALLTRHALDASEVPYNLRVIRKGSDVLPCLLNYWKYGNRVLPDMVMLDLEMPGMSGFEILEELALAPASIRALPIVILTAHKHFDYLQKTNNLYIAAYIEKPCKPEKMREVLRRAHGLVG